jgi:hypothetical protein
MRDGEMCTTAGANVTYFQHVVFDLSRIKMKRRDVRHRSSSRAHDLHLPERDTTRVRESRERDSIPHTARARRADCRRRPRPEACGRLMARLNERRRSRRGVHVRRAASSILPLPTLSHDSMPHTARACRADCRRRPRPEACGRLMARLNARRRCRRGVHVFRAASSLRL